MSPEETLTALQWRYAVKAFDASKKIPPELVRLTKETLRLAPSSFGLQLWKFLYIEDKGLLEKIQAKAWNQAQVTQASQFIVLCRPAQLDDRAVDRFIELTAKTREMEVEKLQGYSKVVKAFISNLSDEKKAAWMDKQIYIALGSLMTVCALHGIDTCPMEGFDPAGVDAVLGLKEKGLAASVMCGLGYRSTEDKYSKLPKVRYPAEEVFETL